MTHDYTSLPTLPLSPYPHIYLIAATPISGGANSNTQSLLERRLALFSSQAGPEDLAARNHGAAALPNCTIQ